MGVQAFLIATHHLNEKVIESYYEIQEATKKCGETYLLFHQKNDAILSELNYFNSFVFTDDILYNLGYVPIRTRRLVPGSNHFPLLKFFLENQQYDYYWYIEDDVFYNGDWKHLFNEFNKIDKDFISSYIEHYEAGSDWTWWDTLYNPYYHVPLEKRMKSFNPIYRISFKALSFIHQLLLKKWRGHHEVLLPTLLYNGGFKIMDFGGDGTFVQPGFENKYYETDTYRFRPIFKHVRSEKNMLYHPVKLY